MTTVQHLLCTIMNSIQVHHHPLVMLQLGNGISDDRPVKSLLALTALAHALNLRIFVFCTRKKPIIVNGCDPTRYLISVLHHLDSFDAVGEWEPLELFDTEFFDEQQALPTAEPHTPIAIFRSEGSKKSRQSEIDHSNISDEKYEEEIISMVMETVEVYYNHHVLSAGRTIDDVREQRRTATGRLPSGFWEM
ncbi:hypothetical protein BJV82DRAFT_338155 [Fennellomyces sp. T-0311]|nr:hypothetical protein BJV82DRAFT_338155 [Fennellomyces sp. T-0311]